MYRTKKYREINEKELEIHSKYKMFRRLDSQHWNEKLFFLGAVFLSWLKIAGIISSIVLCYISLKLLLWRRDINDPAINRDPILRKKIKSIINFSSKMIVLSMGIIVKKENIQYDYSDYLGSNYDRGNDSTIISTYIANHTSWLDVLVLINEITPSFISKSDVKSYPLIGYIGTCLRNLWVDRSDKNNRANIMKMVTERQINNGLGKEFNQLLIFPEGTTTNNTGIIEFKQGAFSTKLNIKPYVIKFDPINNISLAMDVIEMLLHIYIILCKPIHYITVMSLPVFIPNEYLFKKSKFSNEDKEWKVYAESMRDVMCDASGLIKYNGNYDMKVEYLDFLRNQQNAKKND
jgi:1-acyl-sn-glycerol-3-phosphate acyltransferase